MVEHRGPCFDLGRFQMSPAPATPVTIAIGGARNVALRRAARLGDGWIGTGQSPDEALVILVRLRALRAEAGRASQPFDTIVPLVTPPDPDSLRRLADAGMTSTTAWPLLYALGPGSTLLRKRDAMRASSSR